MTQLHLLFVFFTDILLPNQQSKPKDIKFTLIDHSQQILTSVKLKPENCLAC